MDHEQDKSEDLRQTFWRALAASPIVLLQLDADPASAAPMTAQLDEHAHHAVWFFTSRASRYAAAGAATATYASRGHDVFARITGQLAEETDPARLEALWTPAVAAWYPAGRDDPNLLLLRMDLGDAGIWTGEVGALNYIRMALGLSIAEHVRGGHVETRL